MIENNKVQVLNRHAINANLAKSTIQILNNKKYINNLNQEIDISSTLDYAINNSIYYSEDTKLSIKFICQNLKIEVVNETTAQAAHRLNKQNKECVALNFASGTNPGGGFLGGALAQEEDLCRASGLYSCLKNKQLFYNDNILSESKFYTDGIIYSPQVPFFRDTNNEFLEKPFTLSIITCPAPNLSSLNREFLKEEISIILLKRITKILQVAENHGHRNIILGAWGCGVFNNDPKLVAEAFKKALEIISCFEHITFAVYDVRDPPTVFSTFKEVFNG